jgi:hypothetical protein
MTGDLMPTPSDPADTPSIDPGSSSLNIGAPAADPPILPADPVPGTIEISEDEVYTLYDNLRKKIQAQIFVTEDLTALPALEEASQALTDLLDDDDTIHLQANTAQFTALTPKMKATNGTLSDVKAKLDAVTASFAEGAKIAADIGLILTLVSAV